MVSKKEDNQPCILKLTFPLILTFSTKGLLPQDLLRIMLFGDWPRPHSIRKIEGYCSAGEKKTCFVPISPPNSDTQLLIWQSHHTALASHYVYVG